MKKNKPVSKKALASGKKYRLWGKKNSKGLRRVQALRDIPVFNVGSPYYLNYNSDERGHYSVFRITNDKLYAYDVSWNPEDPTELQFPDNWQREIDL